MPNANQKSRSNHKNITYQRWPVRKSQLVNITVIICLDSSYQSSVSKFSGRDAIEMNVFILNKKQQMVHVGLDSCVQKLHSLHSLLFQIESISLPRAVDLYYTGLKHLYVIQSSSIRINQSWEICGLFRLNTLSCCMSRIFGWRWRIIWFLFDLCRFCCDPRKC